jgi:hypothetical protein
MMAFDAYSMYRKQSDQLSLLMFKGVISQNVLVGLASLVENNLEVVNTPQAVLKRVFAIMVELSQNILHHSAERVYLPNQNAPVGTGIVNIFESQGSYTVVSGNIFNKSDEKLILERVKKLQIMDHEALKRLYRDIRQKSYTDDLNKNNLGLGLIDVARRADYPLDISIEPVNDKQSFLAITATVAKDNADKKTSPKN